MNDAAMDSRALIVGESLIDLTITADGRSVRHPGGSPLNVAVGLSRLGVTTTLATQLGDDDDGELVREHLDDSDVDVRSLPPHHADTSVARALLDATGQATYEFDLAWDPSELPGAAGFDLLHTGSIAATLPPGADALIGLCRSAADTGTAVSFDPNVRLAITPDIDDVRRRVLDLAATASVIKLSNEDAETLWPSLSPEQVFELLRETGRVSLLAMTLGSDGVLLSCGDLLVRQPVPKTEVADTIGAGDSFMAALLMALVRRGWLDRRDFGEDDLRTLATVATTAAAITCSRAGANPPTYDELTARLRE